MPTNFLPVASSKRISRVVLILGCVGTTLSLTLWLLAGNRARFAGLDESSSLFLWDHKSGDSPLPPPPTYGETDLPSEHHIPPPHHEWVDGASTAQPSVSNSTLGIASNIYVISLPAREDRRVGMETLRSSLGLEWSYRDGVDRDTDVIRMIADNVRAVREVEHPTGLYDPKTAHVPFAWPESIDSIALQKGPIPPTGSDRWHLPAAVAAWTPRIPRPSDEILTCTKENNTIFPYHEGFEKHQLLTSSVIACWESHLNVIRSIANQEVREDDPTGGATIVLEDDVDMEKDVQERLQRIWPSLPVDWDIVYLGHCWAPDEGTKPPIDNDPPAGSVNVTRLHPSTEPLCMHAYALSRAGARRILMHLTHPSFAYSRVVDQALAWLIASGRLKSFSVVPSVVVQRKASVSDILGEVGDKFRQGLYDGVFHTTSGGIF